MFFGVPKMFLGTPKTFKAFPKTFRERLKCFPKPPKSVKIFKKSSVTEFPKSK